jgi:hypothetical protein
MSVYLLYINEACVNIFTKRVMYKIAHDCFYMFDLGYLGVFLI